MMVPAASLPQYDMTYYMRGIVVSKTIIQANLSDVIEVKAEPVCLIIQAVIVEVKAGLLLCFEAWGLALVRPDVIWRKLGGFRKLAFLGFPPLLAQMK